MKKQTIKFVDYIILVPGLQFSLEFLTSWSQMLCQFYDKGYSFYYNIQYNPMVHSVRNNLLTTQFLGETISSVERHPIDEKNLFANQMKCKKVIFVDSDMVWTPEQMQMLVDSPHPVTVAPYVLSNGKKTSVAIDGFFLSFDELNKHETYFPVDVSGMGFVAIDFEVLEKLKFPFFETYYMPYPYENPDNIKDPITLMGEDASFFTKIKEAGYEIMCDPAIRVGHQKPRILIAGK
jgi:hypothetical protein